VQISALQLADDVNVNDCRQGAKTDEFLDPTITKDLCRPG